MLGASLSFALMASISKLLSKEFDTVQQVFFRNLVGVFFIGSSLIRRPPVHTGGKMGLLLFRGIIGTLSLYLLFYAIATLGLGRATTYQYTYPIFLVLFSAFLFGEKLNGREIAAILTGLSGIWFIFQPDLTMPFRNHLIGLGNALLTTVAYMAIKQLSYVYDSRYIVMSFMLSGIALPLISMILGHFFYWDQLDFLLGHFKWPHQPVYWGYFLLLGISAMVGQVLMTRAFSIGKAGQVAAISYSNIVFSTLLGIGLGESLPTSFMLIGMALIIAGGLLVARKNPPQETGSGQIDDPDK